MVLRMKRLRPGAEPPQRQTAGSAGFDLKACMEEPVTLKPGDRSTFCTGWAVEIPQGCVGLVFCRSGLGAKHGVSLPNCVGVIDSDYRGELQVPLVNLSREPYTVAPGERIAQLVIVRVERAVFEPCKELPASERGEGGFGSSGVSS